jgi:hypothetical protein
MHLVDDLIRRWREAGISVLVASHATDRLQPLMDATIRLEGGLVTEIEGRGVSVNLAPAPVTEPTLAEARR